YAGTFNLSTSTDWSAVVATFSVAGAQPSRPSITTSSMPNGTQGTPYSATLVATGGTTPYTWSIAAGSLPAGLSLASSTGVISGTPVAAGTASFTIQVADVNLQTATKPLSITINPTAGSPIALVQSNSVERTTVR